ncbi:hypothetical protein HPP92_007113 [Vanilla planifolia]|uniref:Glutaredoxin domain-containing protein n=1 Tax=Vanilla planifolia TaxID=51239 RepID=A0A835RDH3_VANPL|nr:hypothetical protein HPP92_007113 [Vanilla planifolia]
MGCVSSAFLDDEDGNLNPPLGHHIVSLTSTTYGLLSTLDEVSFQKTTLPPPPPPPPTALPKLTAQPSTLFAPLRQLEQEIINSWELMEGLDPLTPLKCSTKTKPTSPGKENSLGRVLHFPEQGKKVTILGPANNMKLWRRYSPEMFEKRCPPDGEQAVILYTTTLRGIRKTFEDCNAVRTALDGLGIWIRERDVSMDLGFREELRVLLGGAVVIPSLFVRGRYIGGAKEVLQMHEDGGLSSVVEGMPKVRHGSDVCDGCGGARFLPCFQCYGSRKLVLPVTVATVVVEGGKESGGLRRKGKVVKCLECNENGLVLCPICS